MSFKPEVIADSSGEWCGNALRFATCEEASVYATDLMMRWFAVRDTRVVECGDPVNYRYADHKLIELSPGDPGMADPLPRHVWEITVQLPNGDWEYMRTIGRGSFHEAVKMGLTFADADRGRLVSIANVDPADAPVRARPPLSRLDLDVDAPDEVAPILSAAAEAYKPSGFELATPWPDDRTPLVWNRIAGILDIAARNIEQAVRDHFDPHRPIGSGRRDRARRRK